MNIAFLQKIIGDVALAAEDACSVEVDIEPAVNGCEVTIYKGGYEAGFIIEDLLKYFEGDIMKYKKDILSEFAIVINELEKVGE